MIVENEYRIPYYPLEVSTSPAEWRGGWLCGLLRWIYYKLIPCQLHDWVFPNWLISLMLAEQIYVNYTIEYLSNDEIERIGQMKRHLIDMGERPTVIVLGTRKEPEVKAGYGDYWAEKLLGWRAQIMGLTVRYSPFLDEGEILVC